MSGSLQEAQNQEAEIKVQRFGITIAMPYISHQAGSCSESDSFIAGWKVLPCPGMVEEILLWILSLSTFAIQLQ